MTTVSEADQARQDSFLQMMLENYKARWGTEQGFQAFDPTAEQKDILKGLSGYDKHLQRLQMRDQYYMNMLHGGPSSEWRTANAWEDPYATDEAGLQKIKQQWVQSYNQWQRQNWVNKYGNDEGFKRFRFTPEMEAASANMTPEEAWMYRLQQRTKWYADQMNQGGQGILEPDPTEPATPEPTTPEPTNPVTYVYGGGGGGGATTPQLADRYTQAQMVGQTPERTKRASGKHGWRNYGMGPEGQTIHPSALPVEQQPQTGKGG